MRRKKEIALSSFLQEQTIIQRKQIQLVNKGITLIDQISPFLSSEIEYLNLRNNKIVTLKTIPQFTALKELDLSHNKIPHCDQLLVLQQMPLLKKIYLSNNPFLQQPLDQSILSLILERTTDIDILSLELIKQLQNDEMKIIFLKNYLNKIQLHEQLKQKCKLNTKTNRLQTDQLISKIIPQFYQVIEDPTITTQIQRDALNIKKQQKNSLQNALNQYKGQKEKKINQLLTSIVNLLQESEQFIRENTFLLEVNLNDNTISFSPQRKNKKQFHNTVRIEEEQQYSPVRYIQLSKDDNITLEDITIHQAQPEQKIYHNKHIQNTDTLETARKQNIGVIRPTGRFSSFAEFKESMEQKKKSTKIKTENTPQPLKKNQAYQKEKCKTPQTYHNKSTQKKMDYIKVVESRELSQSKPMKKFNFPVSPLISPSNLNQSTDSWKKALGGIEQLTPQNTQIIYYRYLTKVHPMFSLLHSPSESLKQQQKNTLLDALKSSHKDIFCELLKQKYSNMGVAQQAEYNKEEALRLMIQNQELQRKASQLKEEYIWIDNMYKSLQKQYSQLNQTHNQLLHNLKEKTINHQNIEISYKKIKNCYVNKIQQLQALNRAEEIEEELMAKRQDRIKRNIFKKLVVKGKLWNQVICRQKMAKMERDNDLLQYGIQGFKNNRITNMIIKDMNHKQNTRLNKMVFSQWKLHTISESHYRQLSQRLQTRNSFIFLSLLRQYKNNCQLKKLQLIWANRFRQQHSNKKYYQKWKQYHLYQQHLNCQAVSLWSYKSQNKYFSALRDIVDKRRSLTEYISSLRVRSVYVRQFTKLVYLLRKQVIQNRQKEITVRQSYENYLRKKKIIQLRKFNYQSKRYKSHYIILRAHLFKSILNSLNQQHKKSLKQQTKLSTYLRYLYFSILKKEINRQHIAFMFSRRLNAAKMGEFFGKFKENQRKSTKHRHSDKQMLLLLQKKVIFWKLLLVKNLTSLRLRGCNYVKRKAIEEMNVQMDINDQRSKELIREGYQSLGVLDQQVLYLRQQLQAQSHREAILLAQNESLMLAVNEHCQVMCQLKREVSIFKQEHRSQEQKYNALVRKYNKAVSLIQQAQKIRQCTPKKQ